MDEASAQERFKRGAADAGRFFRYVSDFIGFTEAQAETIRETRFIIEKPIPSIVAAFYAQLLRFPATRRHFLGKDGSLDRPYLELRMQHQANFWRRAASGLERAADGGVGGALAQLPGAGTGRCADGVA